MVMATKHPEALVSEYLRRLEAVGSMLLPDRRRELIAEIRTHIDDALLEAGTADEVTIQNVLERLGPPEEIVAAAGPAPATTASRGKLEIGALVVLALSGLIPVLGWVVGAVLVLASAAWSARDKLVGLALGLLPIILGAIGVMAASAPSGSAVPGAGSGAISNGAGGLGPIELAVLVGWGVLAGPVSAAYLAYRLRHQRPATTRGMFATGGVAGD
jgi:hypothetical protein